MKKSPFAYGGQYVCNRNGWEFEVIGIGELMVFAKWLTGPTPGAEFACDIAVLGAQADNRAAYDAIWNQFGSALENLANK
jgi:hypothetical protein